MKSTLIEGRRLLVGSAGASVVATVIVAARSFALLPVATKSLSVVEYGLWVQLGVASMLMTFVSIAGLDGAVLRFLSGERERAKDSAFAAAVSSGAALSLVIAIGCLGTGLLVVTDEETRFAIAALGALIVGLTVERFALIQFRRLQRVWAYTGGLAMLTVSDIAAIVATLLPGFGVPSAILAWGCTKILVACALLLYSARRYGALSVPSSRELGPLLRFGLPLLGVSLLGWVLNVSDRFLIGWFLNVEQVAYYSVSYSLGSFVSLAFGPTFLVMQPLVSGLWQDGHRDAATRAIWRALEWSVWLALPVLMLLVLWAPDIIARLTRSAYVSAAPSAIVVAVAVFIQMLSGFAETKIMLSRHSRSLLPLYAVSAGVNVLANVALLPRLGYFGAAVATLIAACVLAGSSLFLATRRSRTRFTVTSVLFAAASAVCGLLLVVAVRSISLDFTIVAGAMALLVYAMIGLRVLRPLSSAMGR